MKNVFDNLSGNFSAEIDAPYKLTAVSGARSMGFRASALDQDSSQSQSLSDPRSTNLKLHTAPPSQTACYATDRRRYSSARARKDNESESESVQNLTAGVVLVTDEVNIQFEDDRPSSPLESCETWNAAGRRVTGPE